MSDPVIVIGAHRSGTSVLNRVLAALGVFTGARRDPNDEAWLFLRLNEWLMRQAGARWDRPEAIADLLANREVRPLAADYLRLVLGSPRSLGFLGVGRWLRHGGVLGLAAPWGFKDPRTTFTLPIWLDVFPGARVVHIHRSGVAVAASLRARYRRNLERSRRLYARNRPLLRWLKKRAGFSDSLRCATLAGAFELWEAYVALAHRHVAAAGDRGLEIGYEELAADPRRGALRLADFCGLAPSAAALEQAAGLVRADRCAAHRDDPELRGFAVGVADREAAALGAPARPPRRPVEEAVP